jgi:hypothetical protein
MCEAVTHWGGSELFIPREGKLVRNQPSTFSEVADLLARETTMTHLLNFRAAKFAGAFKGYYLVTRVQEQTSKRHLRHD